MRFANKLKAKASNIYIVLGGSSKVWQYDRMSIEQQELFDTHGMHLRNFFNARNISTCCADFRQLRILEPKP